MPELVPSPAFQTTVGFDAAGVVMAATYTNEGAIGWCGLLIIIFAPAGDAAIGSNGAIVRLAGIHTLENTGRGIGYLAVIGFALCIITPANKSGIISLAAGVAVARCDQVEVVVGGCGLPVDIPAPASGFPVGF